MVENRNPKTDDKFKSLIEMVSDYGYPMEKFFYETDDMYINCVHRIKGKRGTKIEAEVTQKPVVIY